MNEILDSCNLMLNNWYHLQGKNMGDRTYMFKITRARGRTVFYNEFIKLSPDGKTGTYETTNDGSVTFFDNERTVCEPDEHMQKLIRSLTLGHRYNI